MHPRHPQPIDCPPRRSCDSPRREHNSPQGAHPSKMPEELVQEEPPGLLVLKKEPSLEPLLSVEQEPQFLFSPWLLRPPTWPDRFTLWASWVRASTSMDARRLPDDSVHRFRVRHALRELMHHHGMEPRHHGYYHQVCQSAWRYPQRGQKLWPNWWIYAQFMLQSFLHTGRHQFPMVCHTKQQHDGSMPQGIALSSCHGAPWALSSTVHDQQQRVHPSHVQTHHVWENIPTWISLCLTTVFSQQGGISVFKFPKRFSEFSWTKTSLSFSSLALSSLSHHYQPSFESFAMLVFEAQPGIIKVYQTQRL